MFLVQELLYLVHACSSCPTLFPDAVVTGICLLILRCFFPGCTRLARLNAAHLLRPKGTLGKKQGNHSFKSYKVARCPQAPSFPRAPRHPRAPSAPAPAPPAPPAPRTCVSKSCYIALNHEDVLVVDRSCDGSLAARKRSQAVDVDIVMKIGYTTFQSSCHGVRKVSN